MRVLHVMSGFGGGISSFILNKAKYFNNQSMHFDVITFDNVSQEFLEAINNTGGDVYRIPNPKIVGIKQYYEEVNQIMASLPKNTFVHCHITGYRAIPFYLIAKKNKLKYFGIHAHTTGTLESINTPKSKMIRGINNTIASHRISCGRKATSYLFGEKYVEDEKTLYIPNSIDPTLFLEELNITKETMLGNQYKDKFVIGHIGRFRSVKNHMFMLEIIEKLSETQLDFVWIFAGDGDDFEKIKSMTIERGLSEQVIFLGRRNDIPALLQIMDIFVLPSIYEGFPTVAVESQASGTQTILSDTITREVDLGLELIHFLPIDDSAEWVEYILDHLRAKESSPVLRSESLIENKLTNEESAKLYQEKLKEIIINQ